MTQCSCAKPDLLEFSITITVALGKSIPITVVEINIFIKFFKIFLFHYPKELRVQHQLYLEIFLFIKLNF